MIPQVLVVFRFTCVLLSVRVSALDPNQPTFSQDVSYRNERGSGQNLVPRVFPGFTPEVAG